jgi:hypothetical protein
MTAAGIVGLSLPTDRQLSAATASDPHAAAARLMSADPNRISLLSHAFTDSGANVEHLHRMSGQAQRRLADSFRNDRAPIYDEATHRAALPQGFRDSGSHLQSLGRRLGAVADELHAAIADVAAALRRLQTDLDEQRRSWAAELDALGGPERLLAPEAIAGLLAHRNRVAARMQESVTACGRTVAARIDGYNEILGGCLALLNEFTYLRSGADISGTRIDDVLRAGGTGVDEPRPGIAPLTVPTPGGPTVEIFPLPDGPRLEGTHDHPPAPGGPAVDINVPAPPPETQTDRGQIPPHAPPGTHVDTHGGSEPESRKDASVDETLAGLRQGRSPPHLEVDTPEQLRSVWDELASRGTPVASPYPGELEQLPDGTRIGYRAASKSGGATIDVFKADGTHIKVHLP